MPLKFQREGIKYDELSEDEKDAWDALEWDEDGTCPTASSAEAVNKWLFNNDTVDKVLAHLMTRGIKVAGGDRLGKTIVFAKNQAHAEFIAERFNANYPHFKGEFARVITFKTEYAQSLIDEFSAKDKAPHIAISVDMLDTGIDVPEVVNLVFFKLVRSKTKFWQMLGRGTRLCPDLFGPGEDKTSSSTSSTTARTSSTSARIRRRPKARSASRSASGCSTARMELDRGARPAPRRRSDQGSGGRDPVYGDPTTDEEVAARVAGSLHGEVAAMNLDNFVVRPKRRLVEKYAKPESWAVLSAEDPGRAGARGRRAAVRAGRRDRGGQAVRPAHALT